MCTHDFTFRPANLNDIDVIEEWYISIGGKRFLSHCIPSMIESQKSQEYIVLWSIISEQKKEIGTIWLEQKEKYKKELDLGIMLNNAELMGKGKGRSIIKFPDATII